MFLISFNSAVHTAQTTAHVQSVVPPSNAAHSTVSTQSANAVTPKPIENPTCSAVQSSASREIRPVQKNQTSSLPLGTYSFAALVDPSNTFKEGKLTT